MLYNSPSIMPYYQQQHHHDDDASLSSTVDVSSIWKEHEEQHQQQQAQQVPAPAPSSPRRSVRFDMFNTVAIDNEQIFFEDTKDLWYTSLDYKRFKANNTQAAKDIIRADMERRDDPRSFPNVLGRMYTACQSATSLSSRANEQDTQYLTKWLSLSCSRLGLERMVVRSVRTDKFPRRKALTDAVLDLQEEYAYADAGYRAAAMARAAQEISRPSSLLAMQLARANQMPEQLVMQA